MKKLCALLLMAMMLISSASLSLAHSGGTDIYGCHTDSSTGIRH